MADGEGHNKKKSKKASQTPAFNELESNPNFNIQKGSQRILTAFLLFLGG